MGHMRGQVHGEPNKASTKLATIKSLWQVDSMHAAIEYQTQKATIYAPSEWQTVMRNARTPEPYEVQWLKYDDFLDWKAVEGGLMLKKARDQNNNAVKWSAIRQVKVNTTHCNTV